MHYLGPLGKGVEWVYVILEGQASERAPYPGRGANKGSQDLVLKPGKGQSPAEQTSGSFSKDRDEVHGTPPGTRGPPGCHPGSHFFLRWRQQVGPSQKKPLSLKCQPPKHKALVGSALPVTAA